MENCYKKTSSLKIENINRNNVINCSLKCCDNSGFEIKYSGILSKNFFTDCIFPDENDNLIIIAKCKKCQKEYSIFNNNEDGYDNYFEPKSNLNKIEKYNTFKCKKCQKNDYNVTILLEYSDEEFTEKINEQFSWIWIDIICNSCGKKYRKIINFETA